MESLLANWLPSALLALWVFFINKGQSETLAELRGQISHEVWTRQAVWTLKRETYIKLIEAVQAYSISLTKALACEKSDDPLGLPAAVHGVTEARIALVNHQAVADLVISEEALGALLPLYRPKESAPNYAMWSYDNWEQQCGLVGRVQAAFLIAAKRDLGIEVNAAPPV